MPRCPGCNDEVDPDSELCLNCGESLDPVQLKAQGKPAVPPPVPAPRSAPVAAGAPKPAVPKPRRREEEPEVVRCKGCGAPSKAERCPGCGALLRKSD